MLLLFNKSVGGSGITVFDVDVEKLQGLVVLVAIVTRVS
jgi:hypothetical protein